MTFIFCNSIFTHLLNPIKTGHGEIYISVLCNQKSGLGLTEIKNPTYGLWAHRLDFWIKRILH